MVNVEAFGVCVLTQVHYVEHQCVLCKMFVFLMISRRIHQCTLVVFDFLSFCERDNMMNLVDRYPITHVFNTIFSKINRFVFPALHC